MFQDRSGKVLELKKKIIISIKMAAFEREIVQD
jgi:hypothetical protein